MNVLEAVTESLSGFVRSHEVHIFHSSHRIFRRSIDYCSHLHRVIETCSEASVFALWQLDGSYFCARNIFLERLVIRFGIDDIHRSTDEYTGFPANPVLNRFLTIFIGQEIFIC
ncbi:hypothetical protein D3C86_1838160 [compost metagenome]